MHSHRGCLALDTVTCNRKHFPYSAGSRSGQLGPLFTATPRGNCPDWHPRRQPRRISTDTTCLIHINRSASMTGTNRNKVRHSPSGLSKRVQTRRKPLSHRNRLPPHCAACRSRGHRSCRLDGWNAVQAMLRTMAAAEDCRWLGSVIGQDTVPIGPGIGQAPSDSALPFSCARSRATSCSSSARACASRFARRVSRSARRVS